jgi:hypothetical protein
MAARAIPRTTATRRCAGRIALSQVGGLKAASYINQGLRIGSRGWGHAQPWGETWDCRVRCAMKTRC